MKEEISGISLPQSMEKKLLLYTHADGVSFFRALLQERIVGKLPGF